MQFTRIVLFLVSFLLTGGLSAQLNPALISVDGKVNSATVTTIYSLNASPTVVNATELEYDELRVDTVSTAGNEYSIYFVPKADYLGNQSLVVEYYDASAIPGFPAVRYSELDFTIKPSLVTANDEVAISTGTTITLDVVQNDEGSETALDLSAIAYAAGGSATTNGNSIAFTFDEGVNVGYVSYITTDELGTGDNGMVRFLRTGSQGNQTLRLGVNNKESVSFYLADESFELVSAPAFGEMVSDDWVTFTYEPNAEYTGDDAITFVNSDNETCTIDLDVYHKDENSGFVKDDFVFTSIDEPVTFNVLENDFRSTFNIVDHSPELTYNGNGEFSFTPEPGNNGAYLFYYKIFSGLQFQTGNIFVAVDDYEPIASEDYTFVIESGTSYIIKHEAPISGYTFSKLSNPSHGIVTVQYAGTTLSSCGVGVPIYESAIEYFAEPGYSGTDAFDLEYCTTGGNCHVVKINVEVVDTGGDCNCELNCVWPGDFNHDGIVNLNDLIEFGANAGENGKARAVAGNTDWIGSQSDDWGYDSPIDGHDQKYLDANGDGFITLEDASAISENFGRITQLVSKDVYALADSPLTLSTEQTSVDSGEWLILDVSLGTGELPFIDFYGFTFSFNINPDIIIPETVMFEVNNDSWVGQDSPILDILEQPEPGKIHFGATRLTQVPVSGEGIIGQLAFIVGDEIDGFRGKDKSIIKLILDDVIVFDHNGRGREVESNQLSVEITEPQEGTEFDLAVDVYPNPTVEYLNVSSDQIVERYEIYSLTGEHIISKTTMDNDFTIVNPDNLSGLYLVKFISGKRSKVHKVHFISE